MPVQLGAQGQPDFSQPIELMMDCHRRIEHFLDVLLRITNLYAAVPLDEQGRTALLTALDYFKQAAPRHTADEEQSLFPRMRQTGDPALLEAMARMDGLEADHRRAELAHGRLDDLGRRWLKYGQLDKPLVTKFRSILHELNSVYREHIAMEDQQVFTLASKVLDKDALAEVGDEMKARRKENPGRPGSRCAQRRQAELVTSNVEDSAN